MDICKVPTLRHNALNKHSITYVMYNEIENVTRKKEEKGYSESAQEQ